jgi:hypothetical protein
LKCLLLDHVNKCIGEAEYQSEVLGYRIQSQLNKNDYHSRPQESKRFTHAQNHALAESHRRATPHPPPISILCGYPLSRDTIENGHEDAAVVHESYSWLWWMDHKSHTTIHSDNPAGRSSPDDSLSLERRRPTPPPRAPRYLGAYRVVALLD